MEQEKLYVSEEKTYEAHIDEEVHLYGLLHQLAFLAGKIKDREDVEAFIAAAKRVRDWVGSSNLGGFRAAYPDRLINVGIAEQNMVGVGAGLAATGLVPFVCAAGPFLSGRATEQIKADVAYSQHKVILCAMSPGMA